MPDSPRVVGIDLAGSPGRITGICALEGKTIIACAPVQSDEDITAFASSARPELIVVDAPLRLPPGRRTLDDRNGEHFRPCDRELLRRGIKFFPITLGPMRMLTNRGISLRKRFERQGVPTLEMYPGGAQDVWTIPRKQHDLEGLRASLAGLGIRGITDDMNSDELDGITGAYVGVLYLKGRAELIGDEQTGGIILPFPRRSKR